MNSFAARKILQAKRAEKRIRSIMRGNNSKDFHLEALFLWIPKTAGTSIYHHLSRTKGLQKLKNPILFEQSLSSLERDNPSIAVGNWITTGHMDPDFLVRNRVLSRNDLESALTFAVVRDPYARAVSLFRYFQAQGRVPNGHSLETWLQDLPAKLFVTKLGPWNTLGHSQAKPQVNWISPRLWSGPEIYRLEEQHLWPDTIIERTDQLPTLNTSGPQLKPVDLNRATRRAIERVYHEDFDVLGYPKVR